MVNLWTISIGKTTGEVFYGYTNFSCRNADSMSFICFSNHRAFFLNKKLLPSSHQSSTWSMDRSLLHISFLRLFIIRDTFINKVNYALACRFAPFFSIINFNEKKIYTFLWSGHYKGNQFLIKLGCWCWYLTILQLSFLIHVYLLST